MQLGIHGPSGPRIGLDQADVTNPPKQRLDRGHTTRNTHPSHQRDVWPKDPPVDLETVRFKPLAKTPGQRVQRCRNPLATQPDHLLARKPAQSVEFQQEGRPAFDTALRSLFDTMQTIISNATEKCQRDMQTVRGNPATKAAQFLRQGPVQGMSCLFIRPQRQKQAVRGPGLPCDHGTT